MIKSGDTLMNARSGMTACVLGLCCCATLPVVSAGEYTSAYVTEFKGGLPGTVFKSIDSTGKVSYSTSWPEDTVAIQAIPIEPGPSAAHQADNRQRFQKIKHAAEGMARAREKRQAQREEQEKKRLERLALQRAAKPQVYVERVYVGWHPLWWSSHRHGHRAMWPHKIAHPSLRRGDFTRGGPLQPRAFN